MDLTPKDRLAQRCWAVLDCLWQGLLTLQGDLPFGDFVEMRAGGSQLQLQVEVGLCRGAELLATTLQLLLADDDQGLPLLAFATSEGDLLAKLPLLLIEPPDLGLERNSAGQLVALPDSYRRMSAASLGAASLAGADPHDHDENDQDSHDVGHDIEEGVLARYVVIAACRASHRTTAPLSTSSSPLPSSSFFSWSARHAASGTT